MAKFVGGEEHEERGAGREAGYDEQILNVLESNTTLHGAYEIGDAHLIGEGPDLMGNVQIVAGPRVQAAASLGDDASNAAAIALGIPLAAAAGYGVVKAGQAMFSGPSKPWLYKLNPTYWFKTDREKNYIRTEHNAGYQNEQDAIDLDAAERAYKATEAVRQKESRLAEIDQGLKGGMKAAPSAPTTAAQASMPTTPEVSGDMSSPGENPGLDKLILKIFAKNKIPVSANSTLSADQMAKAGQIVGRVIGDPDAAHNWLSGFIERQGIGLTAPTGGQTNIVHGKKTFTPDAPSDVSMKTSASSGYASPWEKGLANSNIMTTVDPTGMPTTGGRRRSNVRGWGSSPWEKGLAYSTVTPSTMSTLDATTGARRPRSRVRGWGSSPWEKGLVNPTFMATVDTTEDPTTGARRKSNVRGWGSSPWEKGLVDPTFMATVDTTEDPTTGARRKSNVRGWGSSPWEKGLAYSTVTPTTMSTLDATTGARRPRSRVRGWGSSPWEKGLVDPTTMTTIATTIDPTTGARRKTNVRGAFIGGPQAMTGQTVWNTLLGAAIPPDNLKQLAHDLFFTRAAPTGDGVVAANMLASKFGVAPNYTYQAFNTDPGRSTLTKLGNDYQKKAAWGQTAPETQSYLNRVAQRMNIVQGGKPLTASSGAFIGGTPQLTGPSIWSVLMGAQLPPDSMKQLAADLNAASATPSAASLPAISIIASKLGTTPPIAYQAFNCKPGQAVLTQLGKDYQVGLTMGNIARPPSASTKNYLNKVAANIGWFTNIQKPSTTSGGVFVGGKKKHYHHKKTGAVVGAVTTSDPQQLAGLAALNKVMQSHASKIAAVAQAKGVGGKAAWNASDVDNVTVNVLTGMKAENGGKAPSKSDALLARNAVRFWALQTGHTISGAHLMGTFVGGSGAFVGLSLGNVLKDVGVAVTAPIWAPAYGAYWVGKKTVQGVKAVGHKIFGGGGSNPDAQRRAALAQAAQRQAAAAQRILAAEQKQDSALQAQQQAQDLADAQSNAEAAEAAASAAEDVAAQTQATQGMSADQSAALADLGINAVSGDGSRIHKLPHGGSWAIIGYLPPAMVGKAARLAATNTRAGKRLRIGADFVRAARKNPVVRAHINTIMGAAKAGNKKARYQAQTIKGGAIADAQRKNAVRTNAAVHHVKAVMAWKKLMRKSLAVGGPATGRFSKWKPFPAVQVGADAPAGKPIAVPMGPKNYPKIKGVPPDVIVAISAASNTFGIPPAVSASVVQAAQAGDKRAQKDLKDAAKVYKAAQKGDPAAQRQMKAVAADMKSGYAPAAQKAAVLAAAVGTTKGMDNYKRRQANALSNAQSARTLVIPSNPPYEIPMPESYFRLISFGGLPEISKRDFSPISFGVGV